MQAQLEDLHGVYVSLASIWRTLKRLGLTAKGVRPYALCSEPLTNVYCIALERCSREIRHCTEGLLVHNWRISS